MKIAASLIVFSFFFHIAMCCLWPGPAVFPVFVGRIQAIVWACVGLSVIGFIWGVVP